jgi:group II intron reverse transcriptase/maturase
MSQKTFERLEYLRKQNSNREWINRNLYRLMYEEDLYILAYERIKSKPGNMTPGSDGETLDGFSRTTIGKIIQDMRTEHFRFQPVRRQFIPKSNGKLRKLGIPSIRDKIVQEVLRMILEAIYDSPHGPYFRESSHGFRPNQSCHTALREYRRNWKAINWMIEGDIQACFDELDHHVLVNILRKKIQDERFLNLIWKLLNAGYMDLHGNKRESLIGSPQGGIASPILANVYLHELDEFIEGLRQRYEKGKEKARNPDYHRLAKRKQQMAAQGQTKTKAFRTLVKHIRQLPTVQVNDPNYIRVKYLRYADDWAIGLCGSKDVAKQIKEEIKIFLSETLKLRLSEEKTSITNARMEKAHFLGTDLTIGKGKIQKIVLTTNQTGKRFKRRSTGWETQMYAPLPKLLKRLKEKGICDQEGTPKAKSGWAMLDIEQMIMLYSSINRGIQNYYRFVDNWRRLSRIQYILQFSLVKTLANKLKTTCKGVFKRFGKELCITIEAKDGKKDRQIRFFYNRDWTKNREAFQRGKAKDIDHLNTSISMRTRSKVGKPCCICGHTEDEGQVEMHHVRHIRKLSHKREPTGFNHIFRKLNRKQIPVCEECHRKIHQGVYDGLKLSSLAYLPL